jgi:hypothetical protein
MSACRRQRRSPCAERDEQLSRQRHDYRLACAASSIGGLGAKPLSKGAVLLKQIYEGVPAAGCVSGSHKNSSAKAALEAHCAGCRIHGVAAILDDLGLVCGLAIRISPQAAILNWLRYRALSGGENCKNGRLGWSAAY